MGRGRTTDTAQRQGVRLEVTEAVLNHVSGSRGGIVGVYLRYARAEEKRVTPEWLSAGKALAVDVVVTHGPRYRMNEVVELGTHVRPT